MLINGTDRRKFYLAKTVANVDTVTQEIHFFLFINPFLANVLILNPQKTPENLCFLVFSGGMECDHWPETSQGYLLITFFQGFVK